MFLVFGIDDFPVWGHGDVCFLRFFPRIFFFFAGKKRHLERKCRVWLTLNARRCSRGSLPVICNCPWCGKGEFKLRLSCSLYSRVLLLYVLLYIILF